MAKKDVENEYRSERKERLSKAAKQKSKKMRDSTDIIAGFIKGIAVVVVIALLCGIVYMFGVPHKLMPALKIGDRTYSAAEYSYYYTSVYQTYANTAYSYVSQYGINLSGFDYTKDPADQTTTDSDGKTITYDEFFRNYVVETLENYNYYLKLAKEQNVQLSDEHKAEIEDNIKELASYATSYGYSTSRYISVLYGKGLNEKKLRSLLEEQYLVAQMIEEQEEEIESKITMDDINALLKEDPSAFQSVDIRLLGIAIEKDKNDKTESNKTESTTNNESTEAENTEAENTEAENTEAENTEAENTEAENTVAENTEAENTEAENTEAENTEAEGTESTKAEEKEEKEPSKAELLANEMLAEVTDEASFIELCKMYCAEDQKETFKDESASLFIGIKKSTVSSNIDKELAEWLFNEERAVGDKRVFVADDYAYVIYIKQTAYLEEDPLVNARHILVSFADIAAEDKTNNKSESDEAKEEDTKKEETADDKTTATEVETKELTASDGTVVSNEGTAYSAEVVLKAYEKAREIYQEYIKGENTEEAFAKLAEKYSDDTASITNDKDSSAYGGLYEDITKGEMVAPFENWVYDSSRKPGDVDIVMTNYGWHVMYFVSAHEEAPWIESARASIVSDELNEYQDEISEKTAGTANTTAFTKIAGNEALKLVNKLYSNN
ncbi:MAG: peptidylprolyl isomerase [Oscillospiraceae bacterium]|nr:peptidylprolyl isomerase [Oscillospiraceae bacterium]